MSEATCPPFITESAERWWARFALPTLRVQRSTLRLRLALPLTRTPGLFDLDRDCQCFGAPAVAGAADGRGAEVVEADGDTGVGVGGAEAIGGIEADPAEVRHVGFRPGVAGLLLGGAVGAQEVPGDEPRRNAAGARAGDEDVGVVLADAALERERFRRRRA